MTKDQPRLPDVARVDEKTVQKVARGEHEAKPPPRRRWTRRGPPAARLTEVRVRPDVWAVARGLTQDPRCIQIVSEEEVIVWNHGPPWPSGGKPDL